MKPLFWILMALLGYGCSGAKVERADPSAAGGPITPTEAAAMVKLGNAYLIDVREQDEIMLGMATPAIWMPYSLVRQEHKTWRTLVERFENDKTKSVILYCRSGGRAESVARGLANLEVTTYNMGGFKNWEEAGLPSHFPQDPVAGQ